MTASSEEILERSKARLADSAKKKPNCWAAYSLAELAPRPCAFTTALVDAMSSCYGGWGRAHSELGFSFHWKLGQKGFFTEICGRMYADLGREAMTYYGTMPLEHDYAELEKNPSSAFYHRPGRPAKTGILGAFLSPLHAWRLLRSDSKMRKQRIRNLLAYGANIDNLEEELDSLSAKAAGKQSEGDTIETIRSLADFTVGRMAKAYIFSSTLADISQMSLEATMTAHSGAEGLALSRMLTCALDGDPSAALTLALCDLAAGKTEERKILKAHGHHAAEPLDVKSPRLSESPAAFEALLSCVRKTGASAIRGQFEEHRQGQIKANVELRKRLMMGLVDKEIHKFFIELDCARAYTVYERMTLDLLIKCAAAMRSALLTIGQAWKIGSDVFYLTPEEIAKKPENFKGLAADRRVEHERALEIALPAVVFSGGLDSLGKRLDYSSEVAVPGIGLTGGSGRGAVKTVQKTGDLGKSLAGSVAVIEAASPLHGPIFAAAKAVIVGSASPSGSATALGRAFGTPVAACVANVFDRFSDGEEVEASGTTGEIKFLRRRNAETGGAGKPA